MWSVGFGGEPGGDRGLHHLFERDVVLGGGSAAVFELRGGVELFGVEGADLDADVAEGGLDPVVLAGEADAAVGADADAEGRGFAEEKAF